MNAETQKLSSILCADICDADGLRKKLGDTEAVRAMERCLSRMERVTRVAKGRTVKAADGQLRVIFGSADAAAEAAGEMQRQVNALPPVSGIRLAIRIGFHHGELSEKNGEENNEAEVDGAAMNLALRLAGAAKAGQVLTTAETVELLPARQREKTRAAEPLSVEDEAAAAGEPVQVFEILWEQSEDGPIAFISAQPPSAKDLRLRLRLGTDEVWLSEHQPTVSIGRDPNAGVVIRDTRASRNHARIELRHNRYVLIDESVNGTHVKFRVTPELVLKRTEIPLHGRGHIGCGYSTADISGKPLEFEVFDRPPKAGKPEEAADY